MYSNMHSHTRPRFREDAALLAITGSSALTPASTCGKCVRKLNKTDMLKPSKQAQAKGSARHANQKSAGDRLCVIVKPPS